jgi:ornithine cyclodeaminase
MLSVPEALIAQLVTAQDAFGAVTACLVAAARGEAENFPVVRQALGEGRQYGFKSGVDWKCCAGPDQPSVQRIFV